MLSSLIQQGTPFLRPEVDFHAFAPEIILVGTIVVVLLADLFTPEGGRAILPSLAGIGLLASLVPILTLALDGTDRAMFGGAYPAADRPEERGEGQEGVSTCSSR